MTPPAPAQPTAASPRTEAMRKGRQADSARRRQRVIATLNRAAADGTEITVTGIARAVLLTELRDVSAAQKVELPCRSVTTLTGMSRSAGRTGRDLDLGATESGHTALNGSPASSSLLLVSTSPIWP